MFCSLRPSSRDFPPTSQALVDSGQSSRGVGLTPREAVLGIEQGPLSIEHGEEVGHALFEALPGVQGRLLALLGRGHEQIAPRLVSTELNQCIFRLLERREQGAFIQSGQTTMGASPARGCARPAPCGLRRALTATRP